MHPNRTTNVLTNKQVAILSIDFEVQQILKDRIPPYDLYITLKGGLASVVIYKRGEEVGVVWANVKAYNRLGIISSEVPTDA
jgi:hypothetical protein